MRAKGAGPACHRGPADSTTDRSTIPHAPRELLHFLLLSPTEQANAIRRLAATGMSDFTIATATRLSVEAIRRIIAEAKP